MPYKSLYHCRNSDTCMGLDTHMNVLFSKLMHMQKSGASHSLDHCNPSVECFNVDQPLCENIIVNFGTINNVCLVLKTFCITPKMR